MNTWEALFFDFDGVLVDSVEVKMFAFAKLFEQYGPDIVKMVVDHHRRNGGMSRFDKFRYYFKEYLGITLSNEELEEMSNKFSNLVVDDIVASPEIKGASQLLRIYFKKNHLFINSATPQKEIEEIVKRRGWTSYFKKILGSPKSKIDNLSYLLKTYNLDPKRCLYFGDSISDYEAAIHCKVQFFAVVKKSDDAFVVFPKNVSCVTDLADALNKLECFSSSTDV